MKKDDWIHTICADKKIGARRLYVAPGILTEDHPNICKIAIGSTHEHVYRESLFETKREALETLRAQLEENLAAVNDEIALLDIQARQCTREKREQAIAWRMRAEAIFLDARGFPVDGDERNALEKVSDAAVNAGNGISPYLDYINECAHGQRKPSPEDYHTFLNETEKRTAQ